MRPRRREIRVRLFARLGRQGPNLLGIRFVIARSYERIDRSNLVGMGVLPLQFPERESIESIALTREETFDLEQIAEGAATLTVSASSGVTFHPRVRIDTPNRAALLPSRQDPPFRAAPAARRRLTAATAKSALSLRIAARRRFVGGRVLWAVRRDVVADR